MRLFPLLLLAVPSIAIPTWDVFTSRQSIVQMVSGSTLIRTNAALDPDATPRFLTSSADPGTPANATVAPQPPHPFSRNSSRFLVSKGTLYQITNETHVLYGDLFNVTAEFNSAVDRSSSPPSRSVFKLHFSSEHSILARSGSWEWLGFHLVFRLGYTQTNHGLFYLCPESTGSSGVYIPIGFGPTPNDCEAIILSP